MRQTRLFDGKANRDPRISYLKEAARAAAEGYWNHSLTAFDRRPVKVQGEKVSDLLGAECERCGAYVHVRPDAKGGQPSLPPIEGSAVSTKCDSDLG